MAAKTGSIELIDNPLLSGSGYATVDSGTVATTGLGGTTDE
ncbi:hypothetical protein [Stieleria marina]